MNERSIVKCEIMEIEILRRRKEDELRWKGKGFASTTSAHYPFSEVPSNAISSVRVKKRS